MRDILTYLLKFLPEAFGDIIAEGAIAVLCFGSIAVVLHLLQKFGIEIDLGNILEYVDEEVFMLVWLLAVVLIAHFGLNLGKSMIRRFA